MPDEERPGGRIGDAADGGVAGGAGEAGETGPACQFPEAEFLSFISGLAAQTLMQLGEIENPLEKKKAVNLQAARYSIDLIAMLQEKTEGNLTDEEKSYLGAVLNDLRLRFVAKTRTRPSPN